MGTAQKVGEYELVQRLGVGGMAEVFLAKRGAGLVVLKRILPSLADMPEFVDAFLNEARIAARLSHPHIVRVLDLAQLEGSICLVLELVDGPHLGKLIEAAAARRERLPIGPVVRLVAQAADALGYAHGVRDEQGQHLGFVHRDVSPDNLLVSSRHGLKIADFGIAKVRSIPKVTQTGVLKGKPSYASPEHIRGLPVDHRADLYGLGVVLFQSLTGKLPFEAPTPIELMRKVMLEDPPQLRALRPEAPAELEAIVAALLEKEADARFPSAKEAQRALEQVLAKVPLSGMDHVAMMVERLAPRPEGPTHVEYSAADLDTGPEQPAPRFNTREELTLPPEPSTDEEMTQPPEVLKVRAASKPPARLVSNEFEAEPTQLEPGQALKAALARERAKELEVEPTRLKPHQTATKPDAQAAPSSTSIVPVAVAGLVAAAIGAAIVLAILHH
ncbi:MAG: protein kinase [Deltaproteobacteria bacterium]|nr:protein kinase [Deltaproteobacteria bacterium]